MEVFVVSLLNGLVYGMLLFMLASGLTLILSMMGVPPPEQPVKLPTVFETGLISVVELSTG